MNIAHKKPREKAEDIVSRLCLKYFLSQEPVADKIPKSINFLLSITVDSFLVIIQIDRNQESPIADLFEKEGLLIKLLSRIDV